MRPVLLAVCRSEIKASLREIGSRSGVTQQAVSKALLKYVRVVPAGEAELLRLKHAAYLASMYKMAVQLYERGQSDRVLLNVLGTMLDLMEREANLLGLDAKIRNRAEPPADRSHVQPTIWNHLAQAPPTDLETLKRIQELDPIEKP
jgi:hypothetical protein